ncbi:MULTISPECIES: class I SAM-dependent methyltransferase [unclassified Carboxylicivirga]|uniref:class I SAM-dependent methyltransferase n=1 Tax=Carboxylicivirga TaxID=1628153 RepID=UPI003D34D7E8
MIKEIYKEMISERARLTIRRELTRINRFFLRGGKYECNVCRRSYRKFLSHGHIIRQNAKCPYCLSLERTRVLWHYLVEEECVRERNLSVLHFAPERGIEQNLKKLSNIKYYSADLNPNLADHLVDITSIPFESDTFDLVICSHVLVEVTDEELALSEIHRVLKKGGRAIIITAILDREVTQEVSLSSKERMKRYGADICRLRGEDFYEHLQNVGFEVYEFNYHKEYSPQRISINSLGSGNTERVFIGEK